MDDGEFTVFVGPSGCGKSTTLRMIAGLEAVSGGQILVADRDISHLEPAQRDMAMVFQDYALYPHMNVAKNMSFALRLAKYPKHEIEKKVATVAEMLGLTPFLNRKPGQLSGGQRQRVAMGRALVRDASTFLFDEPLSNLDAKLRGQMRAELAQMRDQLDKNMIYVTHDQVEAMTLGERIVVMKDGDIMQHGSPKTLYEKPANKFVAGFIGSPPMNFLNAKYKQEQGKGLIEIGDIVFSVNEAIQQSLSHHDNNDLFVGIRPSAFTLSDTDDALYVDVKFVEYIGSQSIVTATLANQTIVVEVSSTQSLKAGDRIGLTVDLEDFYYFDAKTENTIISY